METIKELCAEYAVIIDKQREELESLRAELDEMCLHANAGRLAAIEAENLRAELDKAKAENSLLGRVRNTSIVG